MFATHDKDCKYALHHAFWLYNMHVCVLDWVYFCRSPCEINSFHKAITTEELHCQLRHRATEELSSPAIHQHTSTSHSSPPHPLYLIRTEIKEKNRKRDKVNWLNVSDAFWAGNMAIEIESKGVISTVQLFSLSWRLDESRWRMGGL